MDEWPTVVAFPRRIPHGHQAILAKDHVIHVQVEDGYIVRAEYISLPDEPSIVRGSPQYKNVGGIEAIWRAEG